MWEVKVLRTLVKICQRQKADSRRNPPLAKTLPLEMWLSYCSSDQGQSLGGQDKSSGGEFSSSGGEYLSSGVQGQFAGGESLYSSGKSAQVQKTNSHPEWGHQHQYSHHASSGSLRCQFRYQSQSGSAGCRSCSANAGRARLLSIAADDIIVTARTKNTRFICNKSPSCRHYYRAKF